MNSDGRSVRVSSVLFDIGNTLVPSSRLKRAALAAAAARLETQNLVTSAEELLATYLDIDEHCHELHMNHLYSDRRLVRAVSERLSSHSPLTLEGEFLGTYRAALRSLIKPQPEITRLLKDLQSLGYRLGIVSDGSTDEQIETLWRMNLLPFFTTCIVSEEIGVEKPEPAIFEAALAALPDEPERTLMVGDSVERDVLGAKALGMKAAFVAEYAREAPPAEADWCLQTLVDLRRVLL